MFILFTLRGLFAMVCLIIVMLAVALTIVICGVLIFLLPSRSWRDSARKQLLLLPVLWGKINRLILLTGLKSKWDIDIPAGLAFDKWYLVIANHQSWTDILILVSLFSQHIPVFKFFYKRQLIWQLPVAGIAMWFLDYPAVARYSRDTLRKKPHLMKKSIMQVDQACQLLAEAPSTAVNFVEGTRFTREKHDKQASPYQHLLRPKAQGVSMVMNALPDKLSAVIDVDLYYQPDASVWHLLCGRYKAITVHAHLLPTRPDLIGDFSGDRQLRARYREWLSDVWSQKDERLSALSKKYAEH